LGELDTYARSFLDYLGLVRQEPGLDYLNVLVRQHQSKVPFETLTKIIDYERGYREGNFLPDIGRYVRRTVGAGTGGTCWALTRGFQWLLSALGFEVSYMYMDPGHVCLRVELNQPYYVDVGYAAPLFQAYPLYQSFTTHSPREVFTYAVKGRTIRVTREPGPDKVLRVAPRALQEFKAQIVASNQWTPHSFLTRLSIFSYVDGVPSSLSNGTLKQFFEDRQEERTLTDDEVVYWIERKFGMDPRIYLEAKELHREWMKHYGLENR
jgi:arylamine N-acetyltransferase